VQDSEFIDVHSTLTTVFGALDYRLTSRVDLHAELRQGFGQFSVTAPLHRLPHGCGGFGLAVGGAR
jgi:hypothetical protein